MRAHHTGQRRGQYPERRRGEQRRRDRGPDAEEVGREPELYQQFDVSEYHSEDDEDVEEGSRVFSPSEFEARTH